MDSLFLLLQQDSTTMSQHKETEEPSFNRNAERETIFLPVKVSEKAWNSN